MNPETVRWAVSEIRGTLREEGPRATAERVARVVRKRLQQEPEAGFGPIVGSPSGRAAVGTGASGRGAIGSAFAEAGAISSAAISNAVNGTGAGSTAISSAAISNAVNGTGAGSTEAIITGASSGAQAWSGGVMVLAQPMVAPRWHDRAELIAGAVRALDLGCVVVQADDPWGALTAMQTAAVVFITGVPPNDLLARVVAEAQRLRVPLVYDVVTPVFRVDYAVTGPARVSGPRRSKGWRFWQPPAPPASSTSAVAHRGALRVCRNATTATSVLAGEVARIVPGAVGVLPNGVDDSMRQIALGLQAARSAGLLTGPAGRLVLGYATEARLDERAVDLDLAVIVPALAQLLVRRDDLDVRLVGAADVPRALAQFGDRVRCPAPQSLGDHLWELAACDVLLAPLQYGVPAGQRGTWGTVDAAVVGRPVVASPTGAEVAPVVGVTALEAVTTADWVAAVEALLADPARRAAMGEAATEWAARHQVDGPVASALIDLLAALRVAVV